tara:strand:- start:141 stop:557 length:417 start_codon:yes stop_codon:yes gene_type:complete
MDTNVNSNLGKKRKKEKVKMETEKDLSKILIGEQAINYEVEFKGEKFTFKVRELPWVQITKIASKCLDYSGKKVLIDRSEFDTQFLETALVEAPWPLSKTRLVVRRLNKDFGNILRSKIIPEPFSKEDEELKNELEQH